MSIRNRALTSTVLGGILAVAILTPAVAREATQGRLENADTEPQNWLIGFQNYSSHRYSRLNQINRSNVDKLRVAFVLPMNDGLRGRNTANFEQHALVDDGFLFIDSGNGMTYKVDVRSGTKGIVMWKADAAVSKELTGAERGMAFWGNNVYTDLLDGRVIAVNRDNGEFVWDKQIARVPHPKSSGVNVSKESFSAAPLAADGKIIVGQSNGDGGTRGWVAAINALSGNEVWRTYSVPAPGEFGHDTWADDHGAWKTGGAAFWTTGSYDARQRLTIWGAAQPVPMFDPEFRPGDNLYSNSAMAFDIDTGKIKWFFQYTPNESWDYDEQGVHMLVDAPFGGTARQMVVHFGRNGFYYQLDRTNGQFISATQYVDLVTWTAGIDPKTGKPIEYNPSLKLQAYIPATRWARADTAPKTACPALPGGTRWQPPAYNPVKRIAYLAGEDGCQRHMIVPAVTLADGGIDEKGRRAPGTRADFGLHGLTAAIDVTTGKVIERLATPYANQSGILATAGGVIFTATVDGAVLALNDETLAELWRFETGIGIKAPPISYSVGGKQFIAIAAGAQQPAGFPELGERGWGASLFVFSL